MGRSFEDYIDDYDRKSFGAGSGKKPPTDRFSALDVRKMFDAGTDDYDLSKRDAAELVLDYADDIKGKSRMGGGTERALDKLERYMRQGKKDKDKDKDYEPVTDPEQDPDYEEPQSLTDARDRYNETNITNPENLAPRADTRYTNDPSKDAISAGDDLNDWYGGKFLNHLDAEAEFGTESIDKDMGYFLDKFVYGPPELGDVGDIFEKYRNEIEESA